VNLFDASALLAFLQGEEGAGVVEQALEHGGACSAANWSEVAQKVLAYGRDWELARALLTSYDLRVEPVGTADAEGAAVLWRAGSGLSLGDRLCLALGHRLHATVWTADSSWGTDDPIRQIR
jgi:PIN domain nuclease of toxin-antitoxin system